MEKPLEDTQVTICRKMTLAIKEVRGTSHMHSYKEGFAEVSSNTETLFHWSLNGIASKISPEVVNSGTWDKKGQEIYRVAITSDMWDLAPCHSHFKTREDAIRNAVAFAARNGIELDGYEARAEKKVS